MRDRKFISSLLAIYCLSTLFFCKVLPVGAAGAGGLNGVDFTLNATDLGVLCLSSAYPGATVQVIDDRDNEAQGAGESKKAPAKNKNEAKPVEEEKKPEPVVFGDDPAVLIVHTHATETYLPASSGNYHSKKEKNSVREVGEILAKSLEEEGIAVVHDKTLHDDPSYNNSYYRSYETVEKLLKEYPTVEVVIDLHRDAIAAESKGATVTINGKTCARYMYVVSTVSPTYQTNLQFVQALNKIAGDHYNGFTGSVLERGYQYNQHLGDKAMLLEFGNNRNDIEEVKNTAKIYGKILAETMKAGY